MRVAGLDVGERTIGVAVSDPLGITAQGVKVIRRRQPAADFEELGRIAREYEVRSWVVGLPRNMNGTYGPQAEKVRKFALALTAALGLPVNLYDERLTTVQAEKTLIAGGARRGRRRQVIDRLAAQLILQGYLDALRSADE